MNVLDDLVERGLLDKCSNEEKVRELLATPRTIYCGFDPSAPSMQLGNFVMITILRRLQLAGHRIIGLIGGGTGMIGDPSGKKSERTFLGREAVQHNVECLKKQIGLYLDMGDPAKGLILNNADWWSQINVIEYLRDYGKLFQINYMLDKDIVRSRLDSGISYAEFSYMLLQSGDFLRLYRDHGCQLQIGGGDQWGNLTASLDFVRKSLGGEAEAEVFSARLITDSQGRKFGKSEQGALYLDPTMTSPYRIYQYFLNTDDESVGKFLKIFDLRPLPAIEKDIEEHQSHLGSRLGQRCLAHLMVERVHGEQIADECEKMSAALFTDEYRELSAAILEELSHSLTTAESEPLTLMEALLATKLASSRREAREFLAGNSVRVNGTVTTDGEYVLDKEKSLHGAYYFLKRGKKSFACLKLK